VYICRFSFVGIILLKIFIFCLKLCVLRHVHIVMEGTYYLYCVYPSSRLHVSAQHPLDGISWNLVLGTLYESLSADSKFGPSYAKISGTLPEDFSTFCCGLQCYITIKALSLSDMALGYSYNKSQWDALFLNFILVKSSACFGQIYCPSSGV